jgi:hypothetical protein
MMALARVEGKHEARRTEVTRPPSAALPIEHELVAEKAATLGRAGDRLVAALAALARLETEIAREGADPVRISRRRDLQADAAERLWFLIVQREAVGLGHHEGIYQLYRVPPEVRAVAGLRRR